MATPFPLHPRLNFRCVDFPRSTSVSRRVKGSATAYELSAGYELKLDAGSPDQFLLDYTSNHSAGNGELPLVREQWGNLFGSQHESEVGSQHNNVALRLTKPGGSRWHVT